MPSRIHLDHNASALLAPPVAEYLASGRFPIFQNGSAVHADGQRARALIEEARDRVMKSAGFRRATSKLFFTSGATEGNNTIIFRVVAAARKEINGVVPHVVTSAVEHACVLSPFEQLEKDGEITLTKVSPRGTAGFVPEDFESALKPETVLVCCMGANNETGEVLPLAEIFSSVRSQFSVLTGQTHAVWCHVDAVQLLGKVQKSISELGADSYTLSGHKIGALSGTGAVIISGEEHIFTPFLVGGPQETFRRAGTENLLGIITFGLAAEHVSKTLNSRLAGMERSRNELELFFKEHPEIFSPRRFGKDQLPNTISVQVPGMSAQDLVVGMDLAGVNISSGAACASGKPNPSHVLLAYGYSAAEAKETIRVSVEAEYGESELAQAKDAFLSAVSGMKRPPIEKSAKRFSPIPALNTDSLSMEPLTEGTTTGAGEV